MSVRKCSNDAVPCSLVFSADWTHENLANHIYHSKGFIDESLGPESVYGVPVTEDLVVMASNTSQNDLEAIESLSRKAEKVRRLALRRTPSPPTPIRIVDGNVMIDDMDIAESEKASRISRAIEDARFSMIVCPIHRAPRWTFWQECKHDLVTALRFLLGPYDPWR